MVESNPLYDRALGNGFPWPKARSAGLHRGACSGEAVPFALDSRGCHFLARGNFLPSKPAATASVVTSPSRTDPLASL